jgi:opacity protein-like surface antigen
MNLLIKSKPSQYLVGATLSLIGIAANAVNPIPGWYGGLFLGPSITNNLDFTFTSPVTNTTTTGTIKHGVLGNIGGQMGYRINQFRVEGELLLGMNTYQDLSADGYVIGKASNFNTGIGMKGQTTYGAFLLNGFYDFVTPGGISSFSPYVGVGIGYAHVKNSITFYNNNVEIANSSDTESTSRPAGQGIIGLGWFLDDFTLMGLDFRYFVTQTSQSYSSTRLQVTSINLTFNGSFNL